MSKIQKLFDKAVEQALFELLTEVEAVFKEKKYSRFVMAMGTWFFVDKNGDIIDDLKPAMKKVDKIIDEWDRYLKLTGNAIMIDRNLLKCYHWAPSPEEWFDHNIKDAVKQLMNN